MVTRAEYELQKRNQATMRQVSNLATVEADRVLSLASNYTQQEMGGFLRNVVPGVVDRYGNLNAAAAMKYYDEQRALRLANLSATATRQARQNAARRAERYAGAQLQSQQYLASLPAFDAVAKSATIVDYGMAMFMKNGFQSMKSETTNAMTRAIASYNRDTLLFNSALDPDVIGVQRVAEPNACDFCQTVAFDSYGGTRVTSYAVHWHNNCHCSIETIYRGDKPYRPDYYNDFPYGNTSADPALSPDWNDTKKQFLVQSQ